MTTPATPVTPVDANAPTQAPPPVNPTQALSLDQLLTQAMQQVGPMASIANIGAVPITDESISSSEFDYYKIAKDRADRVTVLLANRIPFGRTHFVEDKGYFICNSQWKKVGDNEVIVQPAAMCCQRLGTPKPRFSALVIHYHATPKAEFINPFGFDLKIWRFGANVFDILRSVNAQWPLDVHDLKIELEGEEKYQKPRVQPFRESMAAQGPFLAKHGNDLQSWITSTMQKIDKSIGRKLDAAGWAEVLGSAATGAVTPMAQDQPITDITALLGGL